jgi:hypothetical protein
MLLSHGPAGHARRGANWCESEGFVPSSPLESLCHSPDQQRDSTNSPRQPLYNGQLLGGFAFSRHACVCRACCHFSSGEFLASSKRFQTFSKTVAGSHVRLVEFLLKFVSLTHMGRLLVKLADSFYLS